MENDGKNGGSYNKNHRYNFEENNENDFTRRYDSSYSRNSGYDNDEYYDDEYDDEYDYDDDDEYYDDEEYESYENSSPVYSNDLNYSSGSYGASKNYYSEVKGGYTRKNYYSDNYHDGHTKKSYYQDGQDSYNRKNYDYEGYQNNKYRSSTKRRRKRKRFPPILKVLIVILCMGGLVFAVYKVSINAFNFGKNIASGGSPETEQLPGGSSSAADVTITIPNGSTTSDIADILYENKLIESKFMFKLKSKMDGYDGQYKEGTYTISTAYDDTEIMDELTKVPIVAENSRITIPEGYKISQIAELAESKGICTKDEFLEAANSRDYDYDFVAAIPERDNLLEGYLFPDTYFFDQNTNARQLVNKMLAQFDAVYNDDLRAKAENVGYNLDEIIRVASMVESEIKVDEERPKAAAVIYNRLKIDMLLQIDSTVQYALGTRNEKVYEKDLEVDSPYNTYKYKGLPLGPICNPGKASIEAAIEPDENNYIYYVVGTDGTGSHVFAETYDEFLKAKSEYQNWLATREQ